MSGGHKYTSRSSIVQRGGAGGGRTIFYKKGWRGGAQGLYHYGVKRIDSTPMFNPWGASKKQYLATPTAGFVPVGLYYMQKGLQPSRAAAYPPQAPPTIAHRAMATGDPKAMGYKSAADYAAAFHSAGTPAPAGQAYTGRDCEW